MNFAMATLGLKEIGKFLWEGKEQGRPFSLPSQRNFPISFKPKVAIAKFVWKMKKKIWYYEKWVGRHASFPPRQSVKYMKRMKFTFKICETVVGGRYIDIIGQFPRCFNLISGGFLFLVQRCM